MKILLIAMSDSIHTARWVTQIAGEGWDIHLFPAMAGTEVHPDMPRVTIHHAPRQTHQAVRTVSYVAGKVFGPFFSRSRSAKLQRLIRTLRPDVVHTLEMQHAGYLALEAKRGMPEGFPPWIVTNWGSDIYLFGRLAEHERQIRALLEGCDYYSCECKRDLCLAREFGFNGTVLPVFPNTGGFDLARAAELRQPGAVSGRRLIMLKGYQNWAGRALVGLRALERCADVLAGYEIAIYSADTDVVISAELFSRATGIPVTLIPLRTRHEEILSYHGRARIAIGLSISDAISTSLLEAMVMGAFPIQSWTACADEWIVDGETGILVHPEDPDVVERAIRRALQDDRLVDDAAQRNGEVVAQRLDRTVIKESTVALYNTVFKRAGAGPAGGEPHSSGQ